MPTAKKADEVKAVAPAAAEAPKTEVKVEAKKAPAKKETAAKKPAAKKAPAKKTAAKKPAAKKAPAKKADAKVEAKAAPAKKAVAKKPAAKKAAAKKAAAKKAPAAKKAIVEPKKFIIQNSADQGISYTDIVKKVNKAFSDKIKTLEIYVKAEEGKAYYVVNGNVTGDVNLF